MVQEVWSSHIYQKEPILGGWFHVVGKQVGGGKHMVTGTS